MHLDGIRTERLFKQFEETEDNEVTEEFLESLKNWGRPWKTWSPEDLVVNLGLFSKNSNHVHKAFWTKYLLCRAPTYKQFSENVKRKCKPRKQLDQLRSHDLDNVYLEFIKHWRKSHQAASGLFNNILENGQLPRLFKKAEKKPCPLLISVETIGNTWLIYNRIITTINEMATI